MTDDPTLTETGDEQDGASDPWNENLPDALQKALKHCVEEYQGQEQYDRRREVLSDRKKRFYERGYQHIYVNGKTGIFSAGVPGALVTTGTGLEIQCPNYINDYNIFQPYMRILEAVHTQNPPGIAFRPENPARSEDIEAADTAEGYKELFNRTNNIKAIQTTIIRMMLVSGRTVLWTRTELDSLTGKQQEKATVYGTLETKVPILAKCAEDCLYIGISVDLDVKILKSKYPHIKDKIKPGMPSIGETTYERIARLGVLQGNRSLSQMGDVLTHLGTESHWYLRPASFIGEYFNEPFDEGQEGQTIGEALNELFPDGCYVCFAGDVYARSQAQPFDEHIVITFPYEGDGMNRLAIMDPMVVVQDRFNDNMNVSGEVFDFGWPSTWIRSDDEDFDSVSSQRAVPFGMRQFKNAASGNPLEHSFFREPNPELPETFVGYTELLWNQLAQFLIAAPPALQGAADADQKTASGYAQARNQAMGQQSVIWGAIQSAMAKMYKQAAICAVNNPDHEAEIVVPGDGQTNRTISLQKLTIGNFNVFPDEDSSFPETTVQKRSTLIQLVELAAQSPVGQEMFQSPDNMGIIKNYMGLEEMVIPADESRKKQLLEIEELLQQSPIPPDPLAVETAAKQHAVQAIVAEHQGQPPPPPFDPASLLQTSVPVDPLDFHVWEFEKCKEWLSSDACRREIAKGNQAGVQNVRLHAQAHQKMIALQAPPPMVAPAAPSRPGAPGAPQLPVKPVGAPA